MVKFIDLFAGIGGFHLALSNLGAECVYASEIDIHARKTYLANFNLNPKLFNDDIRKVAYESIPQSDILCAGFPCQPFSQAGNKKGFYDVDKSERGNLFFCIADIITHKRPKSFILENVRHLLKHDNGKTLKVILKCLEELNYKVSYKILKASDFNVPQNRPRIFIVGFDREQINTNIDFQFPEPLTLTRTMSDIFQGECDKKVGYTIRVGGRGSKIDDRRNWEFYRVSGEIRRIGIVEAKRMMAFPENFKFNVSETQAMKQLGNSVCVDVVQYVADKVINYINNYSKLANNIGINMNKKQNKGEISEFYAFLKIIHDKYISYADKFGNPLNEGITILKLYHEDKQFFIDEKSLIQVIDPKTSNILFTRSIEDFITQDELSHIKDEITNHVATFNLDTLEQKKDLLNIKSFKGKSFSKTDVVIDFKDTAIFKNQSIGIKSHFGNNPTILNASHATNFIYKVENLHKDEILKMQNANYKVKDAICNIYKKGGNLIFIECENPTYHSTLKKIDSNMPEIISEALQLYYQRKIKYLYEYISYIKEIPKNQEIECRLHDFIKNTMLGIFPTKTWNGELVCNGSIVINENGELTFFHTNRDNILKQYFYSKSFFDTPSMTRHRFGQIYSNTNSSDFLIKLNLQIRLAV